MTFNTSKQGACKAIVTAVALLGAALAMPCAHAETYRFEQGGYTDGASLVISMEGADGLIGERSWMDIANVDVTFTGNSLMPAFRYTQDRLEGEFFIFDGLSARDTTLGDTEGDGIYISLPMPSQVVIGAFFSPDSGITAMTTHIRSHWRFADGTVMLVGDTTVAPMRLTSPVPEPAAIAMLSIGLTGLLGLRRDPKRRES